MSEKVEVFHVTWDHPTKVGAYRLMLRRRDDTGLVDAINVQGNELNITVYLSDVMRKYIVKHLVECGMSDLEAHEVIDAVEVL